eukprot:747324-Hanusia_phi.AAC.2
MSQQQLRVLLSFARQDLHETERQGVAFALLRAIIEKKLVCEEVYEIITSVSDQLVTSQSEQTRALCSQTMLLFLLEYPLGAKRLHQHICFLLRNLEYEYETGREAVLLLLLHLVERFPQELIEQFLDLLLLPLVARIVNDESQGCKEHISSLLKALLSRASRKQIDHILDCLLTWFKGQEPLLRRATAQVLGILVQQQGAAAERYVDQLLPLLEEAGELGRMKKSDWETIYFLLSSAEKLQAAVPRIQERQDGCGSAAGEGPGHVGPQGRGEEGAGGTAAAEWRSVRGSAVAVLAGGRGDVRGEACRADAEESGPPHHRHAQQQGHGGRGGGDGGGRGLCKRAGG